MSESIISQLRSISRLLLVRIQQQPAFNSARYIIVVSLATLSLINIRSFPLMWHVRILRHLLIWNIRRVIHPNQRIFMEKSSPVAQDPFKMVMSHKDWAGPDDCDFMGHLSNSSYAKNLDFARVKICVSNLRAFMREGGWMPLAGAGYGYISEIPLFTPYEIRSKVGGWDEKWMYLLSEFVTRPGTTPSSATKQVKPTTEATACLTPEQLKHKPHIVRADGTVLHCVAISKYCFKLGRRTVPPRVVLAVCGFGADNGNWIKATSMQENGKLKDFLMHGWHEEGGWELSEFEHQREAGMQWCRKLTESINEANWLSP